MPVNGQEVDVYFCRDLPNLYIPLARALVFPGHITEEMRHGLLVMNSPKTKKIYFMAIVNGFTYQIVRPSLHHCTI